MAPKPPPSTQLSATTNLQALLFPALTHSLKLANLFQRLLSTTTIYLFLHTYLISILLLRQFIYASRIMLLQTFYASLYASTLLSQHFLSASKQAMRACWKGSEKFRHKIYFEIVAFVLGGGNGVLLLVFWPGWIVLGGGAWVVWGVCG